MTRHVVRGDLIQLALEGKFDVIVHGANCFCVMGAGIAKCIADTFPYAYAADMHTVVGDRAKLGKFSSAQVYIESGSIEVCNAYTQYTPGAVDKSKQLKWISQAFAAISHAFPGATIAYPKIGAGIANGDWSKIYPVICKALKNHDHYLVLKE